MSTDSGFEVYNIPVSTVKIMGFIEAFEEHSTNRNYVINDGTGSIQCILYNNDSPINYAQHTYVKVFGTIRNLEGVNKLMTFHMMELKNLDEMTYHLLDCIHNFCKLTKPEKSACKLLTFIVILLCNINIYSIILCRSWSINSSRKFRKRKNSCSYSYK